MDVCKAKSKLPKVRLAQSSATVPDIFDPPSPLLSLSNDIAMLNLKA